MGRGWDKFERDLDRGPASAITAFWKLGLLVLLLGGLTTCAVTFISRPAELIDKTLEADNVIYNYEWFKTTHEAITSLDTKIRASEKSLTQFKADAGPRKEWHRDDREEYNRLNTILLGLKQQRADVASDYNARARMVNRSIFQGTDTPSHIPTE